MGTHYMTTSEVARRLRVDDYTVRKWIRMGILEAKAITQGKRVRYRIRISTVQAIERRDPQRHRILV